MSVLTDPSTYPISAAAARQLDRPLFGHVDRRRGRAVARRRHHAGDRPGDRRAGRDRGGRVRRRRRARRPVRARGVRRRPLALPGAARAGAAAAQARRADRRARRRARRARRHRLRAAAPLRGLHRPVRGRRHRLLLRLALEAARQHPRRAARVRRLPGARAARRGRGDHPVERADGRRRDGHVRALRRQQRRAQAGRADADDRRRSSPSWRSRRGSRPASSTSSRAPARPSAPALVAHPEVDAITFTGSDATGRAIQAARRGAREAREPRARRQEPVDHLPRRRPRGRAAAAAMAGVWGASGQVCTCGTRVLVHESVHDEVVEHDRRAVARACGSAAGSTRRSRWARSCRPTQLERVQRYVRDRPGRGRRAGARRRAPRRPRLLPRADGLHRRAQRHDDRPGGDLRARDVGAEFSSEEEAYRIANDVEYGLAAGVWTNDLARAHRASRALRVGTVWVNTYQMVYPSVPYGGVKQSGHGRNLGEASLDEFTQTKSVWMKVG